MSQKNFLELPEFAAQTKNEDLLDFYNWNDFSAKSEKIIVLE